MESVFGLVVALLALSVMVVLVAKSLRLPPLLGYLAMGVAIGPFALGLAPDTEVVHWLAEIGVVFLMFSIGVEFSLARLRAMQSLVLGLGSLQVLGSMLLLGLALWAIGRWAGMGWQGAFVLAAALSMSSTAMVMRIAASRGELETPHGRPVVGILLFQDLAVVPLLVLVPAIAASTQGIGADLVSMDLLQLGQYALAFVGVGLLAVYGQRIVRPWLTLVARRKSQELFTLNLLLMTLGLAWVTEHLGLSLALGAFLAGMLISETEFRYQVEADIRPYRDVLLGLFFITVGMRLDLSVILTSPLTLLAGLVALLALKALIIIGLARLFGVPTGPAVKAGLWLAQAGEFGFVLLDPSLLGAVVPDLVLQKVLAIMVLSMLVTPFIMDRSDALALRLVRSEFLRRSLEIHKIASKAVKANQHLIICGFGRCGQNLAQMLDQDDISYVALDLDPQRTREAAAAGSSVVFGDAARRETLTAAGIHRAAALVITYLDKASALHVLHTAKELAPSLAVIVRVRDDTDLQAFRDAGATEVVPEVVEGSLMLASHALALAGMPLRRVVRRVREVRESRYGLFQGFFHGADDEHLDRAERTVMLRTLAVPPTSGRLGVPFAELGLESLGVGIAGLRRGGRRMAVDSAVLLQPGDVLVLRGTPEALAEVEGLLVSLRQ